MRDKMRARASVPVFPATKNSPLSRINGIVCLASSRRSYRTGRPFFFCLESHAERARVRVARDSQFSRRGNGAIGRSRPGGSGEPLKCKRKRDESAIAGNSDLLIREELHVCYVAACIILESVGFPRVSYQAIAESEIEKSENFNIRQSREREDLGI